MALLLPLRAPPYCCSLPYRFSQPVAQLEASYGFALAFHSTVVLLVCPILSGQLEGSIYVILALAFHSTVIFQLRLTHTYHSRPAARM
jgi:hypothetical protein